MLNKTQSLNIQKSLKEQHEEFDAALLHVLHKSTPERQNRADLIEVCTPQNSMLAATVMKRGGLAERWGLHNYDLSTADHFVNARRDLLRIRPRHLWLSPPCTQFSSI